MQKTLISLSFDDGREDTYRVAFKIMKKYGLKGTIHVTTGYVDKTWNEEKWKTAKGPISVEQLKEMKEYNFEISSHGDKHITENNDLSVSIEKLKQWGLINEKIGFSIPRSKLLENKLEFSKYLEINRVSYMRGGRSPLCYSLKSKIIYVLYNLTKIQLFYDLFNRHNCISIRENYIENKYDLFSVIIRYEDNPSTVVKFIKSNINKSKWIILMLHSIQEKNEDNYGKDPWCWDANKFEQLCKELKVMSDAGEILVKPILDVIEDRFPQRQPSLLD